MDDSLIKPDPVPADPLRILPAEQLRSEPTMTFHPGSFASTSPFKTATLPGSTRVRFLILPAMSASSQYFAMEVAENLPAAQEVSTESPPASEMIRLQGTPERSSSPDTTK